MQCDIQIYAVTTQAYNQRYTKSTQDRQMKEQLCQCNDIRSSVRQVHWVHE